MNKNLSFEDLVEIFLERYRGGDAPDIHTFAKEYPEHTTQLLELLPLMLEMEGLGIEKTQNIKTSSSPLPDLTKSDYQLLRKIGAGGMGVVFEAKQISLNRSVAVKLLFSSLTVEPAQRELFENEAKIIAMLHHPNIVKILNAGCSAERCYYAMELIDGKGLDQCNFSSPREIAKIGLQAAKALAYAHSCGIIHRDIKPSNLLLDAQHEVHVGDFGLAFVLKNTAALRENAGTQSGTIRYMAPERLISGENTFAGDQYSFGVTLYELITQKPIFSEKTPQKLIQKICSDPLPELKCAENDLASIINRCTRFQPQDRYPNMESVAEDLQHFINHEPVSAAAPSACRKLSLWAQRKPMAATASLLAIVAFFAFVSALIFGYIRTNSALELAEKNATTADATLSDIFAHIERQPPSESGSKLLSQVMPYYQEIAGQRNLPKTRLIEVNELIGTAAMRSGNYQLAEKAFQEALNLEQNAFFLNQLAEALHKQGKKKSSEATSKQVIEMYPNSYEAVRAYLALGNNQEAFELIQKLLQKDPKNPDYRFQYALLLGKHPQLFRSIKIAGVEPNAAILLNTLAKEYPDKPEYGLAMVDLMRRKLRYAKDFTEHDRQETDLALLLSDRLLGEFPNMPGVISSVVEFHNAYITALRQSGDMTSGRKETERLQGMLEILFYNPETPASAKESLISMQLERLERLANQKKSDVFQALKAKINSELSAYNGARKTEFQKTLNDISAK